MNELIKYKNGALVLDVQVSPEEETVWLTQAQMARLFSVDRTRITRHINNIYKDGELNEKGTCAKNAHMGSNGKQQYTTKLYNLDMIISVGYRVNSKQGIAFRKWAIGILKDYMVKGYAANQKRLDALQKTIEIQSKMLSSTLEIDNDDLLKVVNEYTKALDLLDDYDHQRIRKPSGKKKAYRLTYQECRSIIDSMAKEFNTDVFGVEKEEGKLNGIISAIYQSAFGEDAYPTVEEKAANLLYFLIKDHPFADGCKRIAASLFITFLARNNILFNKNNSKLSNSALVSITLMIAESNPKEKDIMTTLVMNLLGI